MNKPYNPVRDGNCAKAWELLRRNPGLRSDAEWLWKCSKKPGGHEEVARFLDRLELAGTLPGFPIRWMFEPEWLDASDWDSVFLGGHARSRKEDLLREALPDLNDQLINQLCKGGIGEFCKVHPSYILRKPPMLRPHIPFQTAQLSSQLGPRIDYDDESRYPGLLRLHGKGFTFDTPWPDAPELFRHQFQWQWAHYDFSTVSPYTQDRRYLPQPQPVVWLLAQVEERAGPWEELAHDHAMVAQLRRWSNEYHIYAFPRILYTPEQVKEQFEQFGKWCAAILGYESLSVSRKQLPALLGSKVEWELFSYCWQKLQYDRDTSSPPKYQYIPTGKSKALKAFDLEEKRSGGRSQSSDHSTHDERRCKKMENYMFALYPRLDIRAPPSRPLNAQRFCLRLVHGINSKR